MSDIDWSKAPEGATHVHSSGEFYRPADNEKGGEFFDPEVQRWMVLCDDFACVTGMRTVMARPVTPAWTGAGLPPVGTVCEYYWAADVSWRAGTCVAHFDGRAVICDVDDEDCAERLDAHHVRPIRTPEQIAAEEREKAIAEMVATCAHPGSTHTFADCERLYDAGYRKTEGGTP